MDQRVDYEINIRATRELPPNEPFDLYVIATKSFAVRYSAEAIAHLRTTQWS